MWIMVLMDVKVMVVGVVMLLVLIMDKKTLEAPLTEEKEEDTVHSLKEKVVDAMKERLVAAVIIMEKIQLC